MYVHIILWVPSVVIGKTVLVVAVITPAQLSVAVGAVALLRLQVAARFGNDATFAIGFCVSLIIIF